MIKPKLAPIPYSRVLIVAKPSDIVYFPLPNQYNSPRLGYDFIIALSAGENCRSLKSVAAQRQEFELMEGTWICDMKDSQMSAEAVFEELTAMSMSVYLTECRELYVPHVPTDMYREGLCREYYNPNINEVAQGLLKFLYYRRAKLPRLVEPIAETEGWQGDKHTNLAKRLGIDPNSLPSKTTVVHLE